LEEVTPPAPNSGRSREPATTGLVEKAAILEMRRHHHQNITTAPGKKYIYSGEDGTSHTFTLEGTALGYRGKDESRASTGVGEGAGRHRISRVQRHGGVSHRRISNCRGIRRGCCHARARGDCRAAGCEVEVAVLPDMKSRSPDLKSRLRRRRKKWPTHYRRRGRRHHAGRRGGRRGLGRRHY
jgi:hypothetical protein